MFLYLLSVVPAIWFLELDKVEKYNDKLEATSNSTNGTVMTVEEEVAVALSDIAGVSLITSLALEHLKNWLPTFSSYIYMCFYVFLFSLYTYSRVVYMYMYIC